MSERTTETRRFGPQSKGGPATYAHLSRMSRSGAPTPVAQCRRRPGEGAQAPGRGSIIYGDGEAADTGMNLKLGAIHRYRIRIPGNSKSP